MGATQAAARKLFVVLTVGERRYGIAAQEMVEILPALPVQALIGAPRPITGVVNHRGTLTPVIDLRQLLDGRSSRTWLASRIAVVAVGDPTSPRLIGLLAECCTVEPFDAAAAQPGLYLAAAPFLGPLLPTHDDVVQIIDPQMLLTADVLDALLDPAGPR